MNHLYYPGVKIALSTHCIHSLSIWVIVWISSLMLFFTGFCLLDSWCVSTPLNHAPSGLLTVTRAESLQWQQSNHVLRWHCAIAEPRLSLRGRTRSRNKRHSLTLLTPPEDGWCFCERVGVIWVSERRCLDRVLYGYNEHTNTSSYNLFQHSLSEDH